MLREDVAQQAIESLSSNVDEQVQDEVFLSWRELHGKVYKTAEEALYRQAIWRTSVALVERHNARDDVSYTLAVNEFADMTPEEFAQQYLMNEEASQGCSATARGEWTWSREDNMDLPDSVDWREKNIVSKVKNQGKCGSCWTFSTTGTLESHLALYKKEHVLLSEQQLIDCAGAYDNHGCSGGLPSQAFEYIHYNGGLETEDEYPYKGKDGASCSFNNSMSLPGQVRGVVNVTAYDEDSLAAAVATKGPVAVAFEVMSDFRLYNSGVYESPDCGTRPHDVNHAVQAVGYGVSEDGTPYWLIKNSWGPEWGDDGYFKMTRGKNMCAISTCCSFPIV
ncbi:Cysteine proteinase 2 [Hondaea fermentalgiana]|uniref:Cysteine proteinase 2 n=1 Tax=Hondaea fermentalgiana TaxID=2315210 RepID=A0A2R5GUZ8_9STRA|nr:Cysteine proteinase 2 [Hondaea fermentalgiana]|eukprot:GBG33598.1 Cysteine proteinase 2 [Hondaea fermentalgiana]